MEKIRQQFVYGFTERRPAYSSKEELTSYALENVDLWHNEIPSNEFGFLWKMKVDNSVIPSKYSFESVTYVE